MIVGIGSGVFVGGAAAGKDVALLEEKGIHQVVSVMKHVFLEDDEGVVSVHVPLVDGVNAYEDFREAVDVTGWFSTRPGGVLVHCAAGVSRSVAVAAAVYAGKNSMSVREAVSHVKDVHPAAAPEPALLDLAEQWREAFTQRQENIDQWMAEAAPDAHPA